MGIGGEPVSESLEKFSARLKELFSKDLGADSGYPEKTGINMVTADRKTDKRRNTAIAVIAAIVALILIKFLVVDMIVSALSARSQYMNIQESLDQLKASNVNYEKTLDKYNRQGDGRLSPKERRLSDRSDDLDLITDKVGSDATIKNIQISGNKATVSVEGAPMDSVSAIVSDLEGDGRVSYVSVSTTSRDPGSVAATITIKFKSNGGE